MAHVADIRKVAFVGDYVPRKCGIATFTHDIWQAVATQYPETECIVAAVEDVERGYDYPPEVRFQFAEKELPAYRRAADFLNFNNVDVVCLQHEFGIFGGPAGSHILALLRDLGMPVVTTLHTVLREPTADQRRAMRQLAELSASLIVMSERGKTFLQELYHVAEQKIEVVPHGIPDMPFVDPNFYKDQFGVEGKHVLLTFGLLSPNKGIEYVLQALPRVLAEFPNLVYIVLGATHPQLLREQGETYRLFLERLSKDLGIERHVVFYNRFVELRELTEFISAADLYVTPYLNPAQITSGTLAYSFGCGKAVISTPYWHAEELLAGDRGVIVPFCDAGALSDAILQLLRDEPRRHAMRKRAYLLGREMIWSSVAHLYMNSFQRARRSRSDEPLRPLTVRTLGERAYELPPLKLDHLLRMTDSTGLLQHAVYSIPNFREGYCTDDNARALVLCTFLEELGQDVPSVREAASTYAAFLDFAFDSQSGQFRNFLGYNRCWLEEVGSDDCLGRAVWALGTCIGRSKRRAFHYWAAQLFAKAIQACAEATAPRSWALSLIGIHEYFRRLSGDRRVDQIRDELTTRLMQQFEQNASDDWPWFEDIVTYDNAKLSHALILSGRWGHLHQAFDIGLRSLRWLLSIQKSAQGWFRPVGCNGFYPRNQPCAEFDQQAIEVHSMVSACTEAYRSTGDAFWLQEARTTFDWFLGRNDLGLPMYDSTTGGCSDGLHADRINQNQGAESTLAFLLSLAEMNLLEYSLASFRDAVGGEELPRNSQEAHGGR
jgi:glycosyltransferase involved in cell wall biosynthesis